MTKRELQTYKAGWNAVAKEETRLLRGMSMQKKFQQVLSIIKLGAGLGMMQKQDKREEDRPVRLRWSQLKLEYGCE